MTMTPASNTVTELFQCRRLGIIMTPDPTDPAQAGGVMNPASARDGQDRLHLFPRMVTTGNYSRIGDVLVRFSPSGDPVGVEGYRIALEPREQYEKNPRNGGGVEDPRITYIKPLKMFVMTYVALASFGPRIAIAVSRDLRRWRRLGLVRFAHQHDIPIDLNNFDNKDGVFFPDVVRDPQGRPALALMHRLAYFLPHPHIPDEPDSPPEHGMHPGVWISYIPLSRVRWQGARALTHVEQHHVLMKHEAWWEITKIGMGTPPIRTPFGWLALYHGIAPNPDVPEGQHGHFIYRAGLVIFDHDEPRKIVYRSPEPLLSPETPEERTGIVSQVVFPTAIDPRENGRIDFYYGMADTRIGAGTLRLPDKLNIP